MVVQEVVVDCNDIEVDGEYDSSIGDDENSNIVFNVDDCCYWEKME